MQHKPRGVSPQSLWRWATAIDAQRRKPWEEVDHLTLPSASWRRAETIHRQWQRAARRGWAFAENLLRRKWRSALRELQTELQDCEKNLDAHDARVPQAGVADLFRDIVALHEEFDQVEFDFRTQTFSVITESIELEQVELGPFEIMLSWGRTRADRPLTYRVIARDPQPARSNGSVTHPHVQDETLCEGDGASSIRQALREGRLFDFFLVVASVLRTYNVESPHVDLVNWFEIPCRDCGMLGSEHDYWGCEQCGGELCDDCRQSCPACAATSCGDCLGRCTLCEVEHCRSCLTTCANCDSELCGDCLCDDGRCKKCDEQSSQPGLENEEVFHAIQTTTSSIRTAPADAPVQPDRLGQAPVLARLR